MHISDKPSSLWSGTAQNTLGQKLLYLPLYQLGIPKWRHIVCQETPTKLKLCFHRNHVNNYVRNYGNYSNSSYHYSK